MFITNFLFIYVPHFFCLGDFLYTLVPISSGILWANKSIQEGDTQYAPDKLVLFDVLPTVHKSLENDLPPHKKPTIKEKITTIAYRIVLAGSFALQYYVSKYVALLLFIVGFTVLGVLGLGPVQQIDVDTMQARQPPLDPHRMIYMAYPYLLLFTTPWKKSKSKSKAASDDISLFCLPKDLKKCPLLYLYGTVKNVMFHDDGALKYLEREAKENRSKSDAIAVEGTGHYLYLQKPDKCLEEVMKFMAK